MKGRYTFHTADETAAGEGRKMKRDDEAEYESLSDGAVRDTYIRLGSWPEAAAMCQDMDAIRDTVLTADGARSLKAALPAHLTLQHDGAGWWNVVDVELVLPDIAQLIADGNWRGVAKALVDGDTLSGDMLNGWQVAMVAAYLPDELRIDCEGGAIHVRREFFAQEGAA